MKKHVHLAMLACSKCGKLRAHEEWEKAWHNRKIMLVLSRDPHYNEVTAEFLPGDSSSKVLQLAIRVALGRVVARWAADGLAHWKCEQIVLAVLYR